MRLLKLPTVIDRTGLSRSRIYVEIAAGKFPLPVKIGERAIAFVEPEIDAWIDARIAERGAVVVV
jgi:prophage regulatory protein